MFNWRAEGEFLWHLTQRCKGTKERKGFSFSFVQMTAVAPPPLTMPPIPVADNGQWRNVNVRGFNWGGQTHDLNNPDPVRQMGMNWVKFQIKWQPDSRSEEMVARRRLSILRADAREWRLRMVIGHSMPNHP